MSLIKREKFTDLATSVAIANTPLFLLHKIQASPILQELQSHSGQEIFESFKKGVKSIPKTLEDKAAVYTYLVALSKKPDISFLQEALKFLDKAQVTEEDVHSWLVYLCNNLVAQYKPTTFSYVGIQSPSLVSKVDRPLVSVTNTASLIETTTSTLQPFVETKK